VLLNCTFTNNNAEYAGGGMYNSYHSRPTLTNCTFSGNSASDEGGAMHNDLSSPTLTNCTFSNNSASKSGGMFNMESSPTLTNCILWGNIGNEIRINNSADRNPMTIDTCIIEGGINEIVDKEYCTYTNIITGDPKLQTLAYNGGYVETCAVIEGSPAIGAGKVVEGVTTDARGVARSSTAPTIGAFEYTN
jgi:parallel beta-helix repeat protein